MKQRIPQTAAEAELTLRHAIDYLRGDLVTYRVRPCDAACAVIREAIDRMVNEGNREEIVTRLKKQYPEVNFEL